MHGQSTVHALCERPFHRSGSTQQVAQQHHLRPSERHASNRQRHTEAAATLPERPYSVWDGRLQHGTDFLHSHRDIVPDHEHRGL